MMAIGEPGKKVNGGFGRIGEEIDMRYHDEYVAIFKDAPIDWRLERFDKPLYDELTKDGKKIVPGWTWGVFEGEGYSGAIGKRAWPTREEAIADAREAIAKRLKRDAEAQKEADIHNRFLARTFRTREADSAAGAKMPIEYHCDECGASFWAEWRSGYSQNPCCPVCEEDTMIGTEGEGVEERLEKYMPFKSLDELMEEKEIDALAAAPSPDDDDGRYS